MAQSAIRVTVDNETLAFEDAYKVLATSKTVHLQYDTLAIETLQLYHRWFHGQPVKLEVAQLSRSFDLASWLNDDAYKDFIIDQAMPHLLSSGLEPGDTREALWTLCGSVMDDVRSQWRCRPFLWLGRRWFNDDSDSLHSAGHFAWYRFTRLRFDMEAGSWYSDLDAMMTNGGCHLHDHGPASLCYTSRNSQLLPPGLTTTDAGATVIGQFFGSHIAAVDNSLEWHEAEEDYGVEFDSGPAMGRSTHDR